MKRSSQNGYVLVYLLLIIFLFSLVMVPIINILTAETRVLAASVAREQALQIAEAGVNYYQWHLAHFPTDYQDGTGQAGPYVHTYTDADTGRTVGQFSLSITPPPTGSTIVTIQSVGETFANPSIQRTVTVKYGVPSLAIYSFLSNDVIWTGPDETINGQLMSNNGVRFDGTGNAPIQSALTTYTCPSSQGSPCPALENGVWGSASAATQSFWKFPVPAVDFSALTSNLATMKSLAQSGGLYLPPSNAMGYSLVFNSDGTVSVYKVTKLQSNPGGWDINGKARNNNTDYKSRVLQFTQTLPANGTIYAEDNVWVEGTVNGRVTVAAAELPYDQSTAPTIYIPNNILYAAKNGSDVLGLISQSDIVVTYHAPNNLEIDGAMVAQNGSAQFFYYPNNIKNSITVFGSIMTFGQWTWTWVNNSGNSVLSGYPTTIDTYDSNLLYNPPPDFPISTAGYQLLNWQSN
ncbi:hypothetical protein KGQ31_01055 [Patescibacteria group bacterium]|nr:hypothetical protein [Patescibacteria group bacterium]